MKRRQHFPRNSPVHPRVLTPPRCNISQLSKVWFTEPLAKLSTVRHGEEETNISNKGCWFSKLSFQMYHVADIYLINPIVCVYSFPQPQIPEVLPQNIHCPGPESLAFVGAVGSSLHLHRTLLVLCNEGLDVTMTSIPWVVYEGKLVTYTQCVYFCLMSIYHNSLQSKR